MTNTILSKTYTQAARFEQAIDGVIAQLWQQREEGYIKGVDKKKIYWCKITSPKNTKAILVVNGRIESSWKYQELFYDLFSQGFNVYSYDHRGQGLSERLIEGSNMGYVYEFDDYVSDMSSIISHFKLNQYDHCAVLAHSMGGAVTTRYLQTNNNQPFTKVVLSCPMLGIHIPKYLKPIAIPLMQILTAVSAKPSYAMGQGDYYPKPFEGNLLSQSADRYHWFRKLYADKPELQVDGASTRWVWQSLMAVKQCHQLTRQITSPLLLLQGSDDKIVDNTSHQRFLHKLSKTNSKTSLEVIKGSRHELLFEKDTYRNQALDKIFAFLKDQK